MIDWTAGRLRRHWPPVVGMQIAALLCFLVAAVYDPWDFGETLAAAPLTSVQHAFGGILLMLLAGLAFAVLLMPFTGSLVASAFAFLFAQASGTTASAALWALAGAAMLACAGWLAFVRLRTEPASPDVSFVSAEGAPPGAAYRRLWPGIAATLAALAAGPLLVLLHAELLEETVAFEERATVVEAEVLAVDEDDYLSLTVDGIPHSLPTGWLLTVPEPGSRVRLFVDPDDPGLIVVAGADDPSWLLGLALLTPMAAWYAAWHRIVAPLRRRRLAARGGPAGTARVINLGEHLYLVPTDATWPATRLIRVDRLAVPGDDAPDDADAAALPGTPGQLAALLDDMGALASEGVRRFGVDAPHTDTVRLIGIPRRGATIAYQHDGATWFAELTDYPEVFGLRYRLRRIARGRSGLLGMPERLIERRPGLARALWAWLCIAGALVSSWASLADDPSDWVFPVTATVFWAGLPFLFHGIGAGRVELRRNHLVHYGTTHDEAVPACRIGFVSAGEELVGLRLTDPDEVICFPASVLSPHRGALRLLHSWRTAATPARGGRRPSALLLGSIGVLLIGVATLAAALS